jgi:hypothetical protein
MKVYKIKTTSKVRPPEIIENIFEKVRREVAPELPSRSESIYYTPDPECWEGILEGEVVAVDIPDEFPDKSPILDAEWITLAILYAPFGEKAIEECARNYWSGKWLPSGGKPYTLPEILVRKNRNL